MKFKGTKISKRTIVLFAAALVLLVSGGSMGTKAALNVVGDPYEAALNTDQLAVQITENGKEVGAKELGDESTLFTSVSEMTEPGKTYDADIDVKNTGAADAYVRVVVHKYWIKDGEKGLDLSPAYIEPVTTSDWKVVNNSKEPETTIYYYQGELATGSSVDLFNGIRIKEDVLRNGRVKVDQHTVNGVTVVNYIYEYNGLQFVVEAEVQGVQTHSADLAIKSVWGVDASVVGL